MTYRIYFLLFIIITNTCIRATPQQDTQLLFSQTWGKDFQLKITESGEVLTITAIASDSTFLYLYDLSELSLVKIDTSGSVVLKINLESIGRSTYTGDDFIVRDGEAIFLNAVDSRLEFFSCENGAHLKSVSFPRNVLNETKRSRRIINRIYLDGSSVLIGNSHKLVYFQENSLSKQQKGFKAIQFPDDSQMIFYNHHNSIKKTSGKALYSDRTVPIRKSMYGFSGKNLVLLNGKPVQCVISNEGIKVYRE